MKESVLLFLKQIQRNIPNQFILFGSYPLLNCGLRTSVQDIDICTFESSDVWNYFKDSLHCEVRLHPVSGSPSMEYFVDGISIEILEGWRFGFHASFPDLFQDSLKSGELYCASIYAVLAYKLYGYSLPARQQKDLADIKNIIQYLRNTNNIESNQELKDHLNHKTKNSVYVELIMNNYENVISKILLGEL